MTQTFILSEMRVHWNAQNDEQSWSNSDVTA